MHINYRYMLKWINDITITSPGACILDYGCGAGTVVQEGRSLGARVYGVEIFAHDTTRQSVHNAGLLGDAIREIKDSHLDFEDETFDLVVSNQVFEHVTDLETVLAEISRVMKKNGRLLAMFPSRDVIREGHIGIPLAHWFPPDSHMRYSYTLFLRNLGFGSNKAGLTPQDWTNHSLEYLDHFTVYREREEIIRLLSSHFIISSIESDYIRFRLQFKQRPISKLSLRILNAPGITPLACWLFRKLGGMVLLSQKSNR